MKELRNGMCLEGDMTAGGNDPREREKLIMRG